MARWAAYPGWAVDSAGIFCLTCVKNVNIHIVNKFLSKFV